MFTITLHCIMTLFQDIFSDIQKFMASCAAGLISLYAPTYVPIFALTGITVINALYAVQVNKRNNKRGTGLQELKRMFYRIRDAIVAICGAFTIDQFIITSIDLHAVEFIAGAIALIEFWTLLENLSVIHPHWRIWKLLSKFVKKKGEQILDVKLDDILTNDSNTTKNS